MKLSVIQLLSSSSEISSITFLNVWSGMFIPFLSSFLTLFLIISMSFSQALINGLVGRNSDSSNLRFVEILLHILCYMNFRVISNNYKFLVCIVMYCLQKAYEFLWIKSFVCCKDSMNSFCWKNNHKGCLETSWG